MMRYIHEVEGGMNFLFKGVRRRIERRDASPPFSTAADISLGRRRFARLGFWNHKMAVYSSVSDADTSMWLHEKGQVMYWLRFLQISDLPLPPRT